MISKKMEKAINEQINKEFYSAYLYLAMAGYCAAQGLNGFAHWFRGQFGEEQGHAMKFIGYLNEQGATLKLAAIEEPPAEFKSPVDTFEQTYKHEQFVTRSINSIMDVAVAEKDYATQQFLQWFIKEQVEEEATAADLLGKLKLVGDKSHALLMIDSKLGERK